MSYETPTGGEVKQILDKLDKTFSLQDFQDQLRTLYNSEGSSLIDKHKSIELIHKLEAKGMIKRNLLNLSKRGDTPESLNLGFKYSYTKKK